MNEPHYGRRRFLAAAVVVGVGTGIGVAVDALVSGSGTTKKRSTDHSFVSGQFHSTRRDSEVGWTVSFPPGWHPGAQVPLCLVLHGLGGDHNYGFTHLGLQDAQATLARTTPPRPIVLAAVDGGGGYWHPRTNGDDPQGMLMDEFVHMLHTMGISTDRLVAFGWSMGGYGALLLAETYPGRIGRVAVESPAIWPSYAASRNANPDAFDSAADWKTHDVVGHLAALGGISVRVACGLSDPFLPASRQLARLLGPGAVDLAPGGHDDAFWQAHAQGQLGFLAS
jgi:enterochelin esterase-like enzyme